MANRLSEVLNAQGMSVTIACGGMSKVGIGVPALSGSGTLLSVFGSLDGLNFLFPLNVTPFPSGTAVSTMSATGNWEVAVQNYVAIRVVLTTLGAGGSATVIMAASIDSSYQDAFLGATSRYVSQPAANGGVNVVTIAAQANRAQRCRTAVVSFSVAPAAPVQFQITDGASSVLWTEYAPAAAGSYKFNLPADPQVPGVAGGGVVGTPGNSMVFTLNAPGGGGAMTSQLDLEMIAA